VSVEGHQLEPSEVILEPRDVAGFASAVEGGHTVAVTTTITPALADEGLARELVRRIQDMRREAGFDLADRITTWWLGDGDIARVMESHAGYIQAETLSTQLLAAEPGPGAHRSAHDLEGTKVVLGVRRSG
jgi:isoleucyl-tRNA synthetase